MNELFDPSIFFSHPPQFWLELYTKAPKDPIRLSNFLRKQFSPDESIVIANVFSIQKKAQKKFNTTSIVLTDQFAYEQASAHFISLYKESLLPKDAVIADLCCGVGGDSWALSQSHKVIGVDLNKGRLACFLFNLQSPSTMAICADATSLSNSCDHFLLDPDRRSGTNLDKSWNLLDLSPSIPQIKAILNNYRGGLIKLGPVFDENLFDFPFELDFIGDREDCREALFRVGSLCKNPNTIRAIIHDKGTFHSLSRDSSDTLPSANVLSTSDSQFFYEPRKTALRAGFTQILASRFNLYTIHRDLPYLHGSKFILDPFLKAYEILAISSSQDKAIKKALKSMNARVLKCKKRGVLIDPDKETFKYRKLKGSTPVTLVFTRTLESQIVLIVRDL